MLSSISPDILSSKMLFFSDKGICAQSGEPIDVAELRRLIRVAEGQIKWITDHPRAFTIAVSLARYRQIRDQVGGERMRARLGSIYFAKRSDGATKIGFSLQPEKRVTNLRLVMLRCIPGSMADEQALHVLFEDKRIGSEYFELTESDVDLSLSILEEASR